MATHSGARCRACNLPRRFAATAELGSHRTAGAGRGLVQGLWLFRALWHGGKPKDGPQEGDETVRDAALEHGRIWSALCPAVQPQRRSQRQKSCRAVFGSGVEIAAGGGDRDRAWPSVAWTRWMGAPRTGGGSYAAQQIGEVWRSARVICGSGFPAPDRNRSMSATRTLGMEGTSIRTPAMIWPELRSSETMRAAPALRAAATISASQKPTPASSSMRKAADISAGVVSIHRCNWCNVQTLPTRT